MTVGWKDLLNCITDDIITRNKDSLGAEFSLYLLFYNFPLFSVIFISIDEYANKITNLHIRPFHPMKVLYLSYTLLANLIV